MKFVCLTEPELFEVKVRWAENGLKPQNIVNAARTAGFSDREIEEASLGTLEDDYAISPTEIAKAGSVVLGGYNGSMLLDVSK